MRGTGFVAGRVDVASSGIANMTSSSSTWLVESGGVFNVSSSGLLSVTDGATLRSEGGAHIVASSSVLLEGGARAAFAGRTDFTGASVFVCPTCRLSVSRQVAVDSCVVSLGADVTVSGGAFVASDGVLGCSGDVVIGIVRVTSGGAVVWSGASVLNVTGSVLVTGGSLFGGMRAFLASYAVCGGESAGTVCSPSHAAVALDRLGEGLTGIGDVYLHGGVNVSDHSHVVSEGRMHSVSGSSIVGDQTRLSGSGEIAVSSGSAWTMTGRVVVDTSLVMSVRNGASIVLEDCEMLVSSTAHVDCQAGGEVCYSLLASF